MQDFDHQHDLESQNQVVSTMDMGYGLQPLEVQLGAGTCRGDDPKTAQNDFVWMFL